MNGIELFNGDFKPFAVDAVHPIVGADEKYKP